jgi:hypothetical protein
MVVTGTVSRSGDAEFDPFLILEPAAGDEEAPRHEGAAYAFELLDASGAVVARADLDLRFEEEVHGEDRSEVRALDVTPFSLTVPLPTGAVRARLRHGAGILVERERSAHDPAVEMTAVRAEPGGVVELRWRGSDADGDALTYSVFYAADGRSFESVALDLEVPELRFDAGRAATPPGPAAALRVRASDGWRYAEAIVPLPEH